MNNFKKIASFLAVLTLVFLSGRLVTSVLAQSNGDDDENANKVTICHSTSSVTNPYEKITVNKSSADGLPVTDHSDHGNHNGGVFPVTPWGDIIPPFTETIDESTFQYPGKNWDAGQAIYNNGCKMPWSVNITHQEFSCGLNSVTLTGTAQYGGDTTTDLIVKLNGNIVLNSQSEPTSWSTGAVTVVPGQNTVSASVYDKSNPDITGQHQDTPKATDTWQFTIANCPKVCPTGYKLNVDGQCVPDPSPSIVPSSPTPPTCGQDEHLNLQGDKCLKWELGGPPPPPSTSNSGGAVLGASTVNDPGQVLGAHTLGATGSSYDYLGLSLVAAGVAIAVISGYEIKKTL